MKPGHILAAVDFSRFSGKALRTAGMVAARNRARLSVLHASEESVPEASKDLDEFVASWLPEEAPKPAKVMARGVPVYATVDWAKSAGVDMIFCGSYGRTGLQRLLLGSFAEKLVRLSCCPVWVVRAKNAHDVGHILLTTDLSDVSDPAHQAAVELAAQLGCRISALHVLAKPLLRFGGVESLDGFYANALEEAESSMKLTFRDAEVEVEGVVEVGEPAGKIVAFVQKAGVDLVVCGTRSRTGLERMLIGSVAERIVRWVPCSVLIVPTGGEEGACEQAGEGAKPGS